MGDLKKNEVENIHKIQIYTATFMREYLGAKGKGVKEKGGGRG